MLHYRRSGAGRILLLQHGFLAGSGYWLPQFEVLKAEFDLIAPDLPGFAGSTNEPFQKSIAGMAQSVIRLLDELSVDRISLLGHSMGGNVAQQFALDFPNRIERLILYGTAPSGILPRRFEPLEETIHRLREKGVEACVNRILPTWFIEGANAHYYRHCCQAGSGVSAEAAIAALTGVLQWDVRDRLHELRMPVLVICGDSDRSCAPDLAYALWTGIENSQLCIAPGCAHCVHLENPEFFNRAVTEFLQTTQA